MKQLKAKHDYMCLKSILEDVCFLVQKKKTAIQMWLEPFWFEEKQQKDFLEVNIGNLVLP